ncbi:metallophosphatase [Desulforhabdus sp. TSK]|nr:metallophosphatase [Desulforhabdus sp. TSK]
MDLSCCKNSTVLYSMETIAVKPNLCEAPGERSVTTDEGGGNVFVLAHFSDPHLSSLKGVPFTALLNKRLLGYLSWYHRRRHVHCPHILDALLRDIGEVSPDHVAVTGDLTHLGLPDEFRQAARWLQQLGAPDRITVIPGNHDAYVPEPWEETFREWAAYLAGDEPAADGTYPMLRVRGPAALIGLSSARPSAPFLAVGSLGRGQLARFEKILEETGRRGLLRIVLLHHPPVPGSIARRKRLTDAGLLAEVLGRQGAEVILHGHAHLSMAHRLVAGTKNIPVFGVPSASHSPSNRQRAARYHLCRFERRGDGWVMLLTERVYSAADDRFVMARERELFLPVQRP